MDILKQTTRTELGQRYDENGFRFRGDVVVRQTLTTEQHGTGDDWLSKATDGLSIANRDDDPPTNHHVREDNIVQSGPAPSNSWIELKSTPTKGIDVFASRKIPLGTCIIVETPLIFLSPREEIDPSAIEEAFRRLSKPLQSAYLKLFDAEASGLSQIVSIYYSNCYNCDGFKTGVPVGNQSLDGTGTTSRVGGERNGNGAGSVASTCDVATGTHRTRNVVEGGSCVGLISSRLNHNCIPNVQFSYVPSSNQMKFHAVKPISRGKEIWSNYLPSISEGREIRKMKLRLSYGFACDCDACAPRTEFWERSDERRRIIAKLTRRVRDDERGFRQTQREEHGRESDRNSNRKETAMARSVLVEDALDALARLDTVLQKEGLVGVHLMNVYRSLAVWSQRNGDAKMVKMWTDKQLAWRLIGVGG